MNDDDDDQGMFRWTDPDTSRDAAALISVSHLQKLVLDELARREGFPRNGWELATAMRLPTITVVPRLAPLRRMGMITPVGTRPGPSNRSQIAYVIAPKGLAFLASIV